MRQAFFLTALTLLAIVSASINFAAAQSFQQSCTNLKFQGSVIFALCRAANGTMTPTAIDVSGCAGDVANVNGHLVCPRRGAGAPGGVHFPCPRAKHHDAPHPRPRIAAAVRSRARRASRLRASKERNSARTRWVAGIRPAASRNDRPRPRAATRKESQLHSLNPALSCPATPRATRRRAPGGHVAVTAPAGDGVKSRRTAPIECGPPSSGGDRACQLSLGKARLPASLRRRGRDPRGPFTSILPSTGTGSGRRNPAQSGNRRDGRKDPAPGRPMPDPCAGGGAAPPPGRTCDALSSRAPHPLRSARQRPGVVPTTP